MGSTQRIRNHLVLAEDGTGLCREEGEVVTVNDACSLFLLIIWLLSVSIIGGALAVAGIVRNLRKRAEWRRMNLK
jgi:hypothetical protein